MSRHLSPAQVELLDQFDRRQFSDDEFRALAVEAGLSHARIEQAVKDLRDAETSEANTVGELRFAGVLA